MVPQSISRISGPGAVRRRLPGVLIGQSAQLRAPKIRGAPVPASLSRPLRPFDFPHARRFPAGALPLASAVGDCALGAPALHPEIDYWKCLPNGNVSAGADLAKVCALQREFWWNVKCLRR